MSTLTRSPILLQEKMANLQAIQKPQREDTQTKKGAVQEQTMPQITEGREIPLPVVKRAAKKKKKNNQPEAGTKQKDPSEINISTL